MTQAMQLTIDNDSLIRDIQLQFNTQFPYLKLQFSLQALNTNGQRVKQLLLPAHTAIRSIVQRPMPFAIHIHGLMTVTELENAIENETGLYAQVFRSSGNLWLITTATDQWTLDKQNAEGQELSQKNESPTEPLDIHEQE